MFRILFLFFLSFLSLSAQTQPKVYGALEHWTYEASTKTLHLKGWVLAGIDAQKPPKMRVRIQDIDQKIDDISWAPRPDINADNPITDGQTGLGFDVSAPLPHPLQGGTHTLYLEAQFTDGERQLIASAFSGEPQIAVQEIKTRHWRLLAIIVSVIAGIALLGRKKEEWWHPKKTVTQKNILYWLIPGAFLMLVGAGISGSSMRILAENPFGQSIWTVEGTPKHVFRARDVRGDEWGVLIPNVLAQIHHEPQFPIVNTNIGIEGQNMGVIGMTGAPVKQWAALARPATWGYFFLPLRQAMAWQWQLPFWGGLLSVWLLLNVLSPTRHNLNLGLAFIFCIAPYAAAWSNWPLYATMFPAFAFVVATRILTTDNIKNSAILGLVLGWLLACWFLVLYPTWLIIIGSFLVFVAIGWCIDNRSKLRFGRPQYVAIFLGFFVLIGLLASWWMDTRDAFALISATEYPGRRGSMPGGDISWWWFLRGYNNAELVRSGTGLLTNQSEASSYFILPLLYITLSVTYLRNESKKQWIFILSMVFIGCYVLYAFVGFPQWLAKISLWGNMPTHRMDVGLGLACTILFAFLLPSYEARKKNNINLFALIMALASAGIVALALYKTPISLMPYNNLAYSGAMMFASFTIVWWLLHAKIEQGLIMLAMANLATTLSFNPVAFAPQSIELNDDIKYYVTETEDSQRFMRTLILNGDGIGPMAFSAVGVPIVNGVFYYPHRSFWEKMDLPQAQWPIVNRYQHLGFYLVDSVDAENYYRVFAATLDQVHVHVDAKNFDFGKTGAERVVILKGHTDSLYKNSSLEYLGESRDFQWFAVRTATSDQ